jgi:HNH endonuclease
MPVVQLSARFWDKVDKESSECWLWRGAKMSNGYGLFHINGHTELVHRLSYKDAYGDFSAEKQLDHICRVRHCVNPQHLQPVTAALNQKRGKKATQTHCKRGHPLVGDNVRIKANGTRDCRLCRRVRDDTAIRV